MNVYTAAAKVIGAATAGLVLYDAHKNGTINGTMNAKRGIANGLTDHYVQSNNVSKVSTVEVNAKKAWFRYVLDNSLPEALSATFGYVGGFINSVVTDIIPAAMATGALAFNNKFGKLCGIGLLAYGAKYLLYDVMSLGRRDYLKEKI